MEEVVEMSDIEYQQRLSWIRSAACFDDHQARLYGTRHKRRLEYLDAACAQTEIHLALERLNRIIPGRREWQTYDVAYHRWFSTTTTVAREIGATNWCHKGDRAEVGMYVFDQGLYDRAINGLEPLPRGFGH